MAISVWKGRISPLFDVSQEILLIEVKKGVVVRRSEESFDDDDPMHKPNKLAELEVQTLICGAISRQLSGMLAAYGIRTVPFIAGEVEEVISASLAGSLPNPVLAMPGCRGRRLRSRGGSHRGRHNSGSVVPGDKAGLRKEEIMPRGDGTGPQGKGPGTGRGKGGCVDRGTQNPRGRGGQGQGQGSGSGKGQGRGFGKGQGRGRGRGRSGGGN